VAAPEGEEATAGDEADEGDETDERHETDRAAPHRVIAAKPECNLFIYSPRKSFLSKNSKLQNYKDNLNRIYSSSALACC
jgi:hypothetical protein